MTQEVFEERFKQLLKEYKEFKKDLREMDKSGYKFSITPDRRFKDLDDFLEATTTEEKEKAKSMLKRKWDYEEENPNPYK